MNARLYLYGVAALSILGHAALPCPSVRSWAERPVDHDAEVSAAALRQLKADVDYLASEELRGRSVADDSIDQAATYIADRMSGIGLDTDVIEQSPFQTLNVPLGARAGPRENNRVVLSHQQDKFDRIAASLGEGMNPLAIGSGSGKVRGPLVFAGYGITAPKLKYDDYAGIDADGAVVIVLRKEPGAADPDSPFDGKRNTRHAFFATKIDNAIKHGAAAVILVNDPQSVSDGLNNEQRRIDRELERKSKIQQQIENLPEKAVNSRKALAEKIASVDSMVESMKGELQWVGRGVLGISAAGERPVGKDSIPVVSVARDIVDRVLSKTEGSSLAEIETSINESYAPQSLQLSGATANLSVELKPTLAATSNVIGVIGGQGELADQTVILGAHYDHVGMGGYGSLAPGTVAVHNGADDNASGTAAMLSIAAQLQQRLADRSSHRRVVFIGFTGEERGLLGSKHYVRNPRFPLESTVAMVNLDMVGRLRDNELTVYGTGSGDSLDAIVERANERQQFKLFKVPTGYGPSDHQSFYEAGLPVLFFFTGLHNDYHRPSDDSDKINFGGLTRITDIVSEVTFELAVRDQRPAYVETENRVQIRRQMTAFMGVSLADRGDHVVLSGLAEGGPAEKGGLRLGDRLDKLGDKAVKTSADVLGIMRSRSPGDRLKVEVTRSGNPVEVTIRLAPRP